MNNYRFPRIGNFQMDLAEKLKNFTSEKKRKSKEVKSK